MTDGARTFPLPPYWGTMNVGAFVCACGNADLDLEAVRDGVDEVDVVASAERLCLDGRDAMAQVIEEYDLEQLVVTAPEQSCQRRVRALADDLELHPEATSFVDHRDVAARVHDPDEAADKAARLVDARAAGLREEAVSRRVSREAGDHVVVVGSPVTASTLAGATDGDAADVTLVANGRDLSDAEGLGAVTVDRGRVVAVDGRYGEFEVTVEARVTEDCIGCMDCVREGPEGKVTAHPVDIDPDAPGGDWVDVCPTDAIDLDGVTRTIEADQVVFPGGDAVVHPRSDAPAGATPTAGVVGLYTGPVDGATVAAVESLLGGVEKPQYLDLDMDVCAAGDSSQQGCTACSDACPHGAVLRPAVDEVEFDRVACQDCGACTSACPTGATKLREPSNERLAREVEALLAPAEESGWLPWGDDAGIDTEVVAFTCSERAADRLREYGRRAGRGEAVSYPPVLPIGVPCTDAVGEAHVMHALAAGADGVAVVGCGSDCLHSGPEPKAQLVERLNRATGDLGLGERVTFLSPAAEPEPFCADLEAFVDGLEPSPVPTGAHEATGRIDDVVSAAGSGDGAGEGVATDGGASPGGDPATDGGTATAGPSDGRANPSFDSHGWTLESVRAILEHVEPERDVIRGLKDFGRMSVSDDCNFTPTCSNLCPTDAIRRTGDGDLQFNHALCVNCGLCEAGCPEVAIEMHDGLDLGLLPENRGGDPWETVYEGELLECVRCGEPFTSAGSAEMVQEEVGDLVEGIAPSSEHSIFEYCGDCRARLLFETGERR